MHRLYSVADFEPVMITTREAKCLSLDYSDQNAVQFGDKKS